MAPTLHVKSASPYQNWTYLHGKRPPRSPPRTLKNDNGFYCVHLWYDGDHAYTSFVVDPKGDLEYATLDLATDIVSDAQGQPHTPGQAVSFLQEVLRVLPYESQVVHSVQDISPPASNRLSEEHAIRAKAEWETFVNGVGRSIVHPTRADVRGNAEYTIYVYQRLGGQVIRYQLRCGTGRHVQIQKETIERWVGDCWGIM